MKHGRRLRLTKPVLRPCAGLAKLFCPTKNKILPSTRPTCENLTRNFTPYPAIDPGDHSRSQSIMEFRTLGRSGLKVPVLSLGTATFGGGSEVFRAMGESSVAEATRLVDICLEAGVNMFDTADIYHEGLSEEVLGQAIAGRRDKVLVSTKATFKIGPGPNEVGSSRHHLISAC